MVSETKVLNQKEKLVTQQPLDQITICLKFLKEDDLRRMLQQENQDNDQNLIFKIDPTGTSPTTTASSNKHHYMSGK